METTILKAFSRSESPQKVRELGFIPGILNGDATSSTAVQFETVAMNKILSKHGMNAKLWIELDGKRKFGYIMEVQKSPLERKVIHVSIKLVSEDHEVKMRLPITLHGTEELENRQLQIQVYKSEIEVSGKVGLLPNVIIADVSKKERGETVTVTDFHLPPEIKALDSETEIYAIIKAINEVVAETPEKLPIS